MSRYSSQSISGYNTSPPADDGSEVSSNQVSWSKHKTKLADPIKALSEAINTELGNMDGRIYPSGVTTTATNLTLTAASHNGKNIRVSGNSTVTLPEAATATTTFRCVITKTEASNTVTVDTQGSETVDGQSSVTLSENGESIGLVTDGSNWFVDARYLATQPYARGYIDGFALSNNGSDAQHDIDIAAGSCRDDSNTVNIDSSSTFTKQINANWVEGTNQGGFPSTLHSAGGVQADTVYHVFALLNDDGSTVDGGFDTSLTATNLLADATDYAQYRRLGSVLTDGSANIIGFTQDGDEFLLNTPENDFNASAPGTGAVLRALTVPTGIKVEAIVTGYYVDDSPAGAAFVLFTSPDQSDTVPTQTVHSFGFAATGATRASASGAHMRIRTNTSGQIRTRVSQSTADHTLVGVTHGWIDQRGKNA